MHVAVCDDNIADRKQMERLLGRASDRRIHTSGVLYIDSYGNVDAVMRSPMLYDVFFIDMTGGPVNGFQLARKLIDAGVTSPIVLCISTINYKAVVDSATAEMPEEVKDNSNHDILRRQLQKQILYLNKPIRTDALDVMLDHAQELKAQTIPTIELRGETETLYVYEDEILYAEKDGCNAHITLTDSRSIDVMTSMQNLYTQVAGFTHFLPVSEQVLVNVTFVEKLSFFKLIMRDGHSFTVSPLEVGLLKKSIAKSKNA
jgi:DNA-binding LytR/AlgR family response regulator